MKDDYLWDGSGEPDPDIQRLENLLGEFRGTRPAPELPAVVRGPRRVAWPAMAAAAALAIAALTAVAWMQMARQAPDEVANVEKTPPPSTATNEAAGGGISAPTVPSTATPGENTGAVATVRAPGKTVRVTRPVRPAASAAAETAVPPAAPAQRRPDFTAVTEVETAVHLERAEQLLRSFKNARPLGDAGTVDVSYDKQQSRELLYKNILLRQDAEARGNLPVEKLLGSLEPYLIDISNVKPVASSQEIRPIQERLREREVIAELQLYSAVNRVAPGL